MTENSNCKIGGDAPNLNNFDSYEDFKNNVKLWAGFTDYKKERLGSMLAYALPNKSVEFGDYIQKDFFNVHPVSELLNDPDGVNKVLNFLDSHIGKEARITELEAFEKIWSYRRTQEQSILEYLKEHERHYNKCKQLGITFTDTCSAFIVMLGAKLNNTQAELVKGVIDLEKETGKTYGAVKRKLKDMLSDSLGNIVSSDANLTSAEAFIAKNQEAFATWQKNNS